MNIFTGLTRRQKYYALIFLIGFVFKYNYIMLRVFYVPSITGLIMKNLIYILIIIYFFFPLTGNRKGRVFLFLLLFLFTVFFKGNLWYNRYFGGYLSVNDMVMGEGINPTYVLIRQILTFWDLLFVIDLMLMGYLIYKGIENNNSFNTTGPGIFTPVRSKLLLLIAIIVVLLVSQVLTTNILLGGDSPGQLFTRSTSGFVNVYGILPLYVYEYYFLISRDTKVDKAESDPAQTEIGTEIDEDMNIIVIQIESLDAKLLDYTFNGREVTPFLNKLKEESMYFENIYSQHVNGSFDAEFSLLTSLYPVNRNYVFKANDMTQFDSLVRYLKDHGYTTLAFHGNDADFFNRDQAFPDLGFEKFYSKRDFSEADKIMKMEESYLGINDYDFFNQSLNYLENAKEPFFAFMITVTSHTPFNFYPPEESHKEYEDADSVIIKDYLNSISFVDKSLEMFFEELSARGMADNTLFIIYSDHAAGIDKTDYSSGREFILKREVKAPEHIPLLIKYPGVEPGNIEKTGSITDIGPTILDLMGADEKPEGFVGRSLLKGEEQPVLFIHELPQVLYRGHLFIKETETPAGTEELAKIGHLKVREEKEVTLSDEQKEEIMGMIKSMREQVFPDNTSN